MKLLNKIILAVLCICTASLSAEVSAFDAGNISGNSYGLTANEKLLKDKLDTLNKTHLQIQERLNETEQRLEGLQSLSEGVGSQYAKSNARLNALEEKEANITKELENLRAYVEESRAIQENNNKQIKQVLGELSSLMDFLMNKNQAIAKVEPENNASEQNATVKVEPKDESWKEKKYNEILNLAMKDFKNKDKFEDAKEKFQFLISKNHKPARSTFYLGELEYKQKNYAKALEFYKKSIALYDKADYMPTLLYHTAISLDKVGDPKTANGFYKALKAQYPNTPEAKAAPNRK